MEWQPIETAPKDENDYLVCWAKSGNMMGLAFQYEGKWYGTCDDCECGTPTHWMPLPAPPEGI
jgi:hypothetical protein